jgi:TolB-like protein/DNA-binding winged helix-turn-helix (wHTH) protein/tetratricopeptide (TPR) repeat protein
LPADECKVNTSCLFCFSFPSVRLSFGNRLSYVSFCSAPTFGDKLRHRRWSGEFVKDVLRSDVLIRFGVFELDPKSGELRKQGVKVRLQEQPFQILQILLEQPGKVVTREQLRQRIWPADTFVDFNQGLYNATKKLREALGDSAESPRFIETLSRRGYRFIGAVDGNESAVKSDEPSEPETRPEAPGSRRIVRLSITLGLGAAILLGTVLGLGRLWQRLSGVTTVPQIRSMAVLPLENLSGDPAQEYFSEGMTDALITDLAQIGSLKVISRTSSMQYRQPKKSLPEIARELGVDGIVEGTVQRSGNRVRITAQLIYAPSDKHVWANSYERDTRDVFGLEQELAEDIANQVQARLLVGKQMSIAPPPPVDPSVLEAYTQGIYYLEGRGRGGGDEQQERAAAYFQHAIDLDANFALAYVGLARAHDTLSQAKPEDLAILRSAAERALSLDPFSSDARVELGQWKYEMWDWTGAEEDFRRALTLNPNDARAHDSLATVLDIIGKLDEGWKEFTIAQELDPSHDHLADAFYQRGQFDRAIEIRQRIALRDPEFGYNHYALAMNYAQKRMFMEFAVEMGKATTLFGLPDVTDRLEYAFDQSGGEGVLRQWAKELEHLAGSKRLYLPGALAQLYAALGDKDRSFYWLEEYRKHHDVATADATIFFKTDPWFAPIRSDPRFSEFLHRVGIS